MTFYLVGGLEHFLFSHILGIIIPIDFHIFQRGSNHQPVMVHGINMFFLGVSGVLQQTPRQPALLKAESQGTSVDPRGSKGVFCLCQRTPECISGGIYRKHVETHISTHVKPRKNFGFPCFFLEPIHWHEQELAANQLTDLSERFRFLADVFCTELGSAFDGNPRVALGSRSRKF